MNLRIVQAVRAVALSALLFSVSIAAGSDRVAPSSSKIFNPSELENLRGERGNIVSVEGKIVRSGESKTGHVRYLNFTNNYRNSLALVFFVNKGGNEFSMEKLHEWIGKRVRATGKVTEYGSSMQ